MTKSKARKDIAALRQIALDDLEGMDDAQLRQDAFDRGEDIGEVASQVKSAMRQAVAHARRQRMEQARRYLNQGGCPQRRFLNPPSLDRIKEIISGLSESELAPAMAFRDGKTQTDEDWVSLYEDLVDLGAIKVDDLDG